LCIEWNTKCLIDNRERNQAEYCEEFGLNFDVDQFCVDLICKQTASHFDDIKCVSIEERDLEGKLQN
jgi:hypothetical protein